VRAGLRRANERRAEDFLPRLVCAGCFHSFKRVRVSKQEIKAP
jgi:hypothetical protein